MPPQNQPDSEESTRNIRRMASLLRDGNTLLSEACPQCNSPLFKLKTGEIFCASCNKKVVIVKDDDEFDEILQNKIIDESTKVINMKIKELQLKIDAENNLNELQKLTQLFLAFLECLEKLKKIKKS